MKFIELFAGIGGFRNGLEKTGEFQHVWSNEFDKYSASIYRRHYGEIDERDIREVDSREIPEHDLLTAGFPCQAFSLAGNRLGFEDTRGTLFFEVARIAKYYQPMFLLLENVKGLASNDGGKTIETILKTLQELGYYVNYEVYNSKYYEVPQNRERIFFLCTHIKGLDGQNQKIASSKKIIKEWLFQIFLSNLTEVKKLQEHVSKDWVVAWLILKGIITAFGNQKNLKSFKKISKDLLKKSKKDCQPSLLMPSTVKQKSLGEKRKSEVEKLLIVLEEYKSVSTENLWQSIDTFILNMLGGNLKELNKFTTSTAIKQIIDSKTYTFSTMVLAILLATVQLKSSSSHSWNEILSSLIVIKENTKYARINTEEKEYFISESGTSYFADNIQKLQERVFIVGHLRGASGRKVFPLRRKGIENATQVVSNAIDKNYWKGIENHGQRTMIQVGNIDQKGHNSLWGRVYDPKGVSATINAHGGGLGAKTGLYVMRGRNPANPSDRTTGAPTEQRLELNKTNAITTVQKDNLWVEDDRIRRLTPKETERLQAFFDDFTKYGIMDGKVKEMSDTRRYMATGNAVTTSVISAIGEKLLAIQ